MTDISVQGIVKAFEEENNILDGLSFDVFEGEHIGLVGKNGAGKTTLFRIISGEISADSGEIVIAPEKRVGLISQIPKFPDGYTAEDVLKTAHTHVYALGEELKRLEKEMANDASRQVLQKYDRVYNEFMNFGGYELERFRNTVANGLQIPQNQRKQLFESLSGGEKTRINLARLILENTDILLLDEPTNHLDMKASEWLEDYISKFKGTVVTISHDRYFLNRAVDRTIEIVNGKAEFYSGNYSFYVAEKQRRLEEQQKKYEKEQAEIKRLENSRDRLYQWGTGNKSLMKKSFAIQSRLDRMERTERVVKDKTITAQFNKKDFQGDEVLQMRGVSKVYNGRTLFGDVELKVRGGERIAIIGDNGTGKSTLLKIIMQEERADTGLIKKGPAVKTAYLPQVIKFKNPHRNVLDTLVYDENYTPQMARNRLGAFMFSGDDVFRPVSELSGGEQSRLRLCVLMKDDINLLILDEPTNHLDIASREWIEEAVENYDETLLFVSHDRYFINKFATRIWELEDGKINDFTGTFEQFRAYKASIVQNLQAEKEEKREAAAKPKPKKVTPKSVEKQAAKIEKDISRLEEQIAELEKQAEGHQTDYEKLLEIDAEKLKIEEELEGKYAEWEAVMM